MTSDCLSDRIDPLLICAYTLVQENLVKYPDQLESLVSYRVVTLPYNPLSLLLHLSTLSPQKLYQKELQ